MDVEREEIVKLDHLYSASDDNLDAKLIVEWPMKEHETLGSFRGGPDHKLSWTLRQASVNRQINMVDCRFFMLTGILPVLDNNVDVAVLSQP